MTSPWCYSMSDSRPMNVGVGCLHMRIPNDNGNVSQFAGNMYVTAGSRKDPGESGLINPSINMMRTTVYELALPAR